MYKDGDHYEIFKDYNCPHAMRRLNVFWAYIIIAAMTSFKVYEKILIVCEDSTQCFTKFVCYIQIMTITGIIMVTSVYLNMQN